MNEMGFNEGGCSVFSTYEDALQSAHKEHARPYGLTNQEGLDEDCPYYDYQILIEEKIVTHNQREVYLPKVDEKIKYELDVFEQAIHVHLEGCTVNIIRENEGYMVDMWPPHFGVSDSPVATLEVSDAQIQKDLEHFSYEVMVKATITKSIVVDALNKDQAEEQAHEMFNVLIDPYDEKYEQETVGETQLIK